MSSSCIHSRSPFFPMLSLHKLNQQPNTAQLLWLTRNQPNRHLYNQNSSVKTKAIPIANSLLLGVTNKPDIKVFLGTRMQSLQDILYSSLPLQCASSGASSEIVYTPQVKNSMIPKIDQVFESLEDVHKFYNEYAKEAGFGIRAHSSKLGKDGQTIRKEFVCYKQGLRDKKYTQNVSENTIRKRGLTRENCGAKLTVVKRGAEFVVTIFIDGHSHPLATPRKVHLIRSHRKVTPAQRALTEQLGNANVSTHQAMSILEMQSGGLENVGCSQQDIYNAQRDKRKMVEGRDAELLLEYFEAQQEKNPDFTFSIK